MKRGDLILFVFSGILMLSSFSALGREPLTIEQRVKAQEAIEKVYYNHRIWPKENKTPKPAFETMVSKETIENKVTDYLKKSAALEKYWYRPITGDQLQAEMDRMAKGTKDPATLNELFEALNNDPYLIAECLARPVLADRLVRNWYANDERFHKETRDKAEEIRKKLTTENFCSYPEGKYSKMTYRLEMKNSEPEMDRLDPEDHSIGLSEKEFEKMFQEIPEEGKISGVIEKNDCFVILHTALKNEGEIIVEGMTFKKVSSEEWLKGQEVIKNLPKTEGNVSMYLPPVMESGCVEGWDNGILDDMPCERICHCAVWTGTEMIIWGGFILHDHELTALSTGGLYNPSTDNWTGISASSNVPTPRGSSAAVWTGLEMIVWGGLNGATYYKNGGRYNPSSDSWLLISEDSNPLSARSHPSAIWTGSEMIIWGGYSSSGTNRYYYNDGGRYDPATGQWIGTSVEATTPSARMWHSAVWTGSKMIIWGGVYHDGSIYIYFNTGGVYDPMTNGWISTSTGANVPSVRCRHSAVWTGSEMIIWGGDNAYIDGYQNSGGRYNPVSNTWVITSVNSNTPSARLGHVAIWTGSEMIVWGGIDEDDYANTGGIYIPTNDTWNATSESANVPQARVSFSGIWTGIELIIWGGHDRYGKSLNTGGRYNPSSDDWVPTSRINNPEKRTDHTAVWTGTEMIVWGGLTYTDNYYPLYTGGKYNTSTDSWISTSTGANCPMPRHLHTAVWTGSEMIVWGGHNIGSAYLNCGGKYNPISDTWSSTSLDINVPASRFRHTAVWTGSEMVIWGGDGYLPTPKNDGGRYNPSTNSWLSTSIGVNCPSVRSYHTSVWSGTEMIVWGGNNNYEYYNDGGKYNPLNDSWQPTSTGVNLPSMRKDHTAVWTGSEMIIWGGLFYDGSSSFILNTGGRYNPHLDAWNATSTGTNCPEERYWHSVVWTGSEMIVWGGFRSDGSYGYNLNSGGKYYPLEDKWVVTSTLAPVPVGRYDHSAVWTEDSMIIWGGQSSWNGHLGGIYYPGTFIQPSISGSTSNTCPSSSVSLSIPASYSSYQWNLDGSQISGATSSAYEATVSGSYTVSVTDSNSCSGTSDSHSVTITPCIPNIIYQSHGTFSQVTGDGDSYFERGEKWSVPVTVTNSGNTPASNVTAVFSGNGITVCNPTGSFGTIAAGGTGTYAYSFVIDDDFTPCGGNINFNLGSKVCTELTPAGADETNLFLVQVGQIAAGVPTDLVLQPSTADSYVNQGSAGTNYGSGATMSVQSRLSQAQRTLVMFDLSAIPENSVINSATLELYASSAPTTGLTLNVHKITGSWTEAGVTWTNQPSFTSTANASITGGTSTGWKIWNIASLVQDWVDGTSDNYGLIVKGSVENDKTALTYIFASKENGTSGNRPILRINYTPPTTMNCDYVGSGECDAVLTECAPGDTYENGQTWSGTSQSWPSLTGATGYKLYRGIQSGLPNLLTADPDSCLRYEGSSTSIDLSADDPSSEIGRLYWYIVSGTNGSGEGPAGNGRMVNSSGVCE
ncbi:MAG TPA: DNRLRE domain-containing protein [Acidobacteriota bacterium]|nr:DNRLRE domain-containing protein [Acidobacteriota bacterium]HNT17261.1 DNRLRE domain-containing protein [Acidobacteriota bacterium]